MSIFAGQKPERGGIQRSEIVAALAEVTAIFTIFIVAFTGRDAFGDGVKQFLTVLSLLAGALGALAGGWVLLRGIQIQTGRVGRLALGGFMAFIGIYTFVHVL